MLLRISRLACSFIIRIHIMHCQAQTITGYVPLSLHPTILDGVGFLHRHFLPLPKGSASMKAREANLQVLYEISCSQGQQPIQAFTG